MQNKHFKKIDDEEEYQQFFKKLDAKRNRRELYKSVFWLFLFVGAIYVTYYWDEFIENPLFVLLGALGATVIVTIVYFILD